MARVVLVHGAFNELWGPFELRARWLPALRDGLWHHGATVADDDVAVCFYGDLFRRDPTAPDDAFTRTRPGVADLLTRMAGDAGVEGLGEVAGQATFERTVDLVTMMAARPGLRDDVHARFVGSLGDDTRVVVGHSLGSIVAYTGLRRHPDHRVDTLVTLGSPLGDPRLLGMLQPPVTAGAPDAWPGAVRRWLNVAAVGDPVARVTDLAPVYGGGVETVLIDNGHRAHEPEPYLNALPTGAAIADALRERAAG